MYTSNIHRFLNLKDLKAVNNIYTFIINETLKEMTANYKKCIINAILIPTLEHSFM